MIAGFVDPRILVWLVALVPAWIVLLPTLVAPVERKVEAKVKAAIVRRKVARHARAASPADARAGLSLVDVNRSGALAIAEIEHEARGGDGLEHEAPPSGAIAGRPRD